MYFRAFLDKTEQVFSCANLECKKYINLTERIYINIIHI
jgi:hypothetical protein